jgi:predicted DNA-binding protein YlxM (UPF0122 family)
MNLRNVKTAPAMMNNEIEGKLLPVSLIRKILPFCDERTLRKKFIIVIVNNIECIDEQEIIDALGVDDLSEPFLDINQAAKFLNCSRVYLHDRASRGFVPYYQFESKKGSPFLFRKSQLMKMYSLKLDFDYKLIENYVKFKPFLNLLRLYMNSSVIKKSLTEQKLEIFNAYYFENKTFDDIRKKYNFTRQGVQSILQKTNSQLLDRLSQINNFLAIKENELVVKKLKTQNIKLKHTIRILREECVCGKMKETQESGVDYSHKALKMLDKKLIDCNLSVRALGCLKSAGIETVEQLIEYDLKELLKFRNFGERSLKEIKAFLKENDLKLNYQKLFSK